MSSRRSVMLSEGAGPRPAKPPRAGNSRKYLSKKEFGAKIMLEMEKRQLSQSELARETGLARDMISRYVLGKSFPDPKNVKKLADFFEMESSDLLPNFNMQAIADRDAEPELEMRVLPDAPDRAVLRINREVSVKLGSQIIGLLAGESLPVKKSSAK